MFIVEAFDPLRNRGSTASVLLILSRRYLILLNFLARGGRRLQCLVHQDSKVPCNSKADIPVDSFCKKNTNN